MGICHFPRTLIRETCLLLKPFSLLLNCAKRCQRPLCLEQRFGAAVNTPCPCTVSCEKRPWVLLGFVRCAGRSDSDECSAASRGRGGIGRPGAGPPSDRASPALQPWQMTQPQARASSPPIFMAWNLGSPPTPGLSFLFCKTGGSHLNRSRKGKSGRGKKASPFGGWQRLQDAAGLSGHLCSCPTSDLGPHPLLALIQHRGQGPLSFCLSPSPLFFFEPQLQKVKFTGFLGSWRMATPRPHSGAGLTTGRPGPLLPTPHRGQPGLGVAWALPGHRSTARARADWFSMFCLHVTSIYINSTVQSLTCFLLLFPFGSVFGRSELLCLCGSSRSSVSMGRVLYTSSCPTNTSGYARCHGAAQATPGPFPGSPHTGRARGPWARHLPRRAAPACGPTRRPEPAASHVPANANLLCARGTRASSTEVTVTPANTSESRPGRHLM